MSFNREKFRQQRKKLRWSIKNLSLATGLSRESISKWENGQRTPSEKSIYKLASSLGIQVSEISDLKNIYPKSEDTISKHVIDSNLNLLDKLEDEGDLSIKNIISCLTKLNNNLKSVSKTLTTILANTSNILYIKDLDQKYVLVSRAFLDVFSLDAKYISRGKSDADFFNPRESSLNSKEDLEVLNSGKPIKNRERHIFGCRKKRWGIVNKMPIFDSENKVSGLLCMILDITDKKKKDNYSDILEYAINQTKTSIWVGKGKDKTDSPFLTREVLFWKKSSFNQYWGDVNPEDYDLTATRGLWFNSFSEANKHRIIEEKKYYKFPVTRSYFVKSLDEKRKIWITERIFHDEENDIFVGLITEDSDRLKLDLLANIVKNTPQMCVWCGTIRSTGKFNYSYISNPYNLTGYDSNEFLSGNVDIADLVYREHLSMFKNLSNIDTSYPVVFDFKIISKSGEEKWLRGSFFKADKDDDDRMYEYFGYYTDITEDKYLVDFLVESKLK